MPSRRRRQVELERVLGTPALFATAYGNVGSSIYYALGLTAVFALGLTPLVFVVAGVIFACTAATYAEGTVRFPEAGGSSSFARHAFNELVSFGAGWAQMLVYVVTVATSAFFVPHYLSIFWEPLHENPWDIVGGIVVIVVLVALNVVGVQEAARSSSRSPSSTSRRRCCSSRSASCSSSAPRSWSTTSTGAWRRPGRTSRSPSRWRCSPTPASRRSRTSPRRCATPCGACRTRTSSSRSPSSRSTSRCRSSRSRRCRSQEIDGELTTLLALPPEEGGYANDPVLGVVDNLGLEGALLDGLQIYVGVLAATILFIATNAGVIGASRITYSMATYRQIPEVFRRLHPRFKTPWLSIVLFAGIAPIAVILPGDVDFVGTLYSFGATLSFTVAHAAIVRMRMRPGPEEDAVPRRPNLRVGGVDWPLFAVFGGIATGISFVVILVQNPATRWAGLGWLALGFVVYAIYRRRVVGEPLTETVKAPPAYGPALALEYRRLLVPVLPGLASDEALDVACSLAAERGARITAVSVIEVPLDLPLGRRAGGGGGGANRELDEARAIGESYGVRVLEPARSAPAAPARRSSRRPSGAAPRSSSSARRAGTSGRRGGRVFGATVDYVLKNAPCRVLVTRRDRGRSVKLYRGAVVVLALAVRRHRRRAARRHGRRGRRRARLRARRALPRARRRAADAAPQGGAVTLMARKLRGFERILDAPALFAVAYGELASSIYFALGIVAAYALGLTPLVLLVTGFCS